MMYRYLASDWLYSSNRCYWPITEQQNTKCSFWLWLYCTLYSTTQNCILFHIYNATLNSVWTSCVWRSIVCCFYKQLVVPINWWQSYLIMIKLLSEHWCLLSYCCSRHFIKVICCSALCCPKQTLFNHGKLINKFTVWVAQYFTYCLFAYFFISSLMSSCECTV